MIAMSAAVINIKAGMYLLSNRNGKPGTHATRKAHQYWLRFQCAISESF